MIGIKRKTNVIRDNSFERTLFCLILITNIVFFGITVVVTRGETLSSVFFHDINDTFMDFFNSICHTINRRPYIIGSIYPPLAYVIFYIFSRFLSESQVDFISVGNLNGASIRETQGGRLAITVFLMLVFLLLILILTSCIKEKPLVKNGIIISICFSAPVYYTIERGNILILSMVFTLIFCITYNTPNKVMRETGYISLAIAAGIKIYPAILGIILIKERRYKETIRCVIYGLIFFLLPFLFIGGLESVPLLIKNILTTSEGFSRDIGYGWKVNFSNSFMVLGKMIGFHDVSELFVQVLVIGIMIMCIVSAFFIKTRWKTVALLMLIAVGGPEFSFVYSVSFMVIPLVMLLNQKERYSTGDRIYLFLFLVLLGYYPFGNVKYKGISNGWPYTKGTFIISICLIILTLLLVSEGIQELSKAVIRIKNNHNKNFRRNV